MLVYFRRVERNAHSWLSQRCVLMPTDGKIEHCKTNNKYVWARTTLFFFGKQWKPTMLSLSLKHALAYHTLLGSRISDCGSRIAAMYDGGPACRRKLMRRNVDSIKVSYSCVNIDYFGVMRGMHIPESRNAAFGWKLKTSAAVAAIWRTAGETAQSIAVIRNNKHVWAWIALIFGKIRELETTHIPGSTEHGNVTKCRWIGTKYRSNT